jgi:hypothetical protein
MAKFVKLQTDEASKEIDIYVNTENILHFEETSKNHVVIEFIGGRHIGVSGSAADIALRFQPEAYPKLRY